MDEEPNVEETLVLAKKVLSSHRLWLKKKSATVSPVVEEMDYDFKDYSISSNSTMPRHQGETAPFLELQGRATTDWDEQAVLPTEDVPTRPGESGRKIRKKRRSRATVVPVNVSGNLKPDTNAWERDSSEIPTSLESNTVNRRLRLEERLADVQGSSDTSSNCGDDSTTMVQNSPSQSLSHQRSVHSLTNTSTPTHNEQRQLQPQFKDQLRKSSTPDIVSFVTPITATAAATSTSSINGHNSNTSSSSSVVVIKPGTIKKKLARNKVQPIHVVQPSKPVVPVRIHHSVVSSPAHSSEGDIVLEDAEDWIPPEEVLKLKPKKKEVLSYDNQQVNDIRVTDATGHHIVQLPIKKDNTNKSTLAIQMCDDKSDTAEISLTPNTSNSVIPFSPKSNKKDSKITVVEDIDDVPPPLKPQNITKHPPLHKSGTTTITSHSVPLTEKHTSYSDGEVEPASSVLTCSPSLVKKPQPIPFSQKGSDDEQYQEETKIVTETQEPAEDKENRVPLLKVKAVSSIYIPDYKFLKKRDRVPPGYRIHCHQRAGLLPPACPLYGIRQPTPSEVLGSSVYGPKARNTPPTPETEIRSHSSVQHEYSRPPTTISTNKDTTASTGPSELHVAARDGNLRKLQTLLSDGHDVDEIDDEGRTPLMYCVLPNGKAQLHCVDLLMRMGANLDHQSSEGFTVLHLASYCGIVSLMELLIMNGANVDLKDIDGRLPLHWGTHPVSNRPLDLLLKHSVHDVHVLDYSEMTLLMWSCYNCNATVTKYLLGKKADPEEKDNEGKTAMHWACSQNDIHCLQLLLTSDMTYFKDHKGCTVIHTAAQYGFILGVQLILSKRSESVHDTDKEGRTPLHYAAASDRVDICYLLLNKGADATRTDNHGLTALEYAKKTCNEYVVALFTCHKSSMADYTRRERTLRNDSRRLTASSHDAFDTITQESLLSHDFDTISVTTTASSSSKFKNDEECIEQASIGCYLGYFTYRDHHKLTDKELKDPPCHYYFWISPKDKMLCWSRSKSKQSKTMYKITKVEEGPSNLVMSRPDYSPQDLHQFAFRVWLEGGQPLDLLAYTSDYYYMWTVGIRALLQIDNDSLVKESPEETRNKASSDGLKKGLELM